MNRATLVREVGHTFNKIEVLSLDRLKRHDNQTSFKKYVSAKCHCGNVFSVRLDLLKSGRTKSCGCITKKRSLQLVNTKQIKPVDPGAVDPKTLPSSIYEWGLGQQKPNSYAAVVKVRGEMHLLVVPWEKSGSQKDALSKLTTWRSHMMKHYP